jgi:hypothetical protein
MTPNIKTPVSMPKNRFIRKLFILSLKNTGIANTYRISDKTSMIADIVNIINEIIFEFPEREIVRPRSLKKLCQKEYPDVFGSVNVPPA